MSRGECPTPVLSTLHLFYRPIAYLHVSITFFIVFIAALQLGDLGEIRCRPVLGWLLVIFVVVEKQFN